LFVAIGHPARPVPIEAVRDAVPRRGALVAVQVVIRDERDLVAHTELKADDRPATVERDAPRLDLRMRPRPLHSDRSRCRPAAERSLANEASQLPEPRPGTRPRRCLAAHLPSAWSHAP